MADSRSIGALALPGSILGVALLAIAACLYWMGGMISGPGAALGQLGWFTGAWVVMMAAMMLPSVAPMALAFARISGERARRQQAAFVPTWIFILGYFAAWTLYGLLAFAIDHLIRLWDPAWLAWDRQGAVVAGGSIVLAGVYQLTPFKRACLTHCRSPFDFFVSCWREGAGGAFKMGAHHGIYCIGCCWGLMLVLFAVGVMSLLWMAVIAVLIFAEKVFRAGPRLTAIFGVALMVFGAWMAIAPASVPGLHPPAAGSDMGDMTM